MPATTDPDVLLLALLHRSESGDPDSLEADLHRILDHATEHGTGEDVGEAVDTAAFFQVNAVQGGRRQGEDLAESCPPTSLARLLEEASQWSPFTGPKGGKGWRNNKTGKVHYGDKPPGGTTAAGNDEPAKDTQPPQPTDVHAKLAKWRDDVAKDTGLDATSILMGAKMQAGIIRERWQASGDPKLAQDANDPVKLLNAAHDAAVLVLLKYRLEDSMTLPDVRNVHDEFYHKASEAGIDPLELQKTAVEEGYPKAWRPDPVASVKAAYEEALSHLKLKKKWAEEQKAADAAKVQAKASSSAFVGSQGPNPALPDSSRPKISGADEEDVFDYTIDKHYKPLNKGLRTGKPPLKGRVLKIHGTLQRLFGQVEPFAEPVTVYRGLDIPRKDVGAFIAQFTQAHETGKLMELVGYQSTSTSDKLDSFPGNVRLVISAVHGLDLKPYSAYPNENELLMDTHARVRVTGIVNHGTEKNPKYEIRLEQLPPGRKGE